MKVRKTIAVLVAFGLTGIGPAFAATNNVNSRGQFVPMGTLRSTAGTYSHRPAYRQTVTHTPAATPAPVIVQAPTAAVATAPTEGRRFSYSPAVEQSTASPATMGTHHVHRMHTHCYSRSTVNRYALPKTDPRKFSE